METVFIDSATDRTQAWDIADAVAGEIKRLGLVGVWAVGVRYAGKGTGYVVEARLIDSGNYEQLNYGQLGG